VGVQAPSGKPEPTAYGDEKHYQQHIRVGRTEAGETGEAEDDHQPTGDNDQRTEEPQQFVFRLTRYCVTFTHVVSP
jgi:hypothetical protein